MSMENATEFSLPIVLGAEGGFRVRSEDKK
jgi:hypothetical protein